MVLEKDQRYLMIEYKHKQLLEQHQKNASDISKSSGMISTPKSHLNRSFMVNLCYLVVIIIIYYGDRSLMMIQGC